MSTTTPPLPLRCDHDGPCPQPSTARRVRAAALCLRLWPAAEALGGFASAQLSVRVPPFVDARPDVAVALTDPPRDGRLRVAPVLVVLLGPGGPAAPERWLAAGVAAVWVRHDDGAVEWPRRRARRVPADGVLHVPRHPALSVPAAVLTGEGRAGRGGSSGRTALG
jgi:hypothetical protein